jgi:FMN phosphatase YigB (HAD superfamily)
MVGDSPDRDIAGARGVGMHALWVQTGRPRVDAGVDENEVAHAILERLEELLPWLERQSSAQAP